METDGNFYGADAGWMTDKPATAEKSADADDADADDADIAYDTDAKADNHSDADDDDAGWQGQQNNFVCNI